MAKRTKPKRAAKTPKKSTAKKSTAKKSTAKKSSPKKSSRATPGTPKARGDLTTRIAAALGGLRAWAASGAGTVDEARPKNDAKARLRAPDPEWGKVVWALPPSYTAFLAHASRFAIRWGEAEGHDEFVVLGPGEMADTGGIVYMPEDVSRDEGVYLSTNHLVPFASAGNDECAFCFDITQASASGEYPVYFHHQDEPRARIKSTGKWEDPQSATPDFPDFTAWLEWVTAELTAGRELPHSYPSAFHNMPGRRGS